MAAGTPAGAVPAPSTASHSRSQCASGTAGQLDPDVSCGCQPRAASLRRMLVSTITDSLKEGRYQLALPGRGGGATAHNGTPKRLRSRFGRRGACRRSRLRGRRLRRHRALARQCPRPAQGEQARPRSPLPLRCARQGAALISEAPSMRVLGALRRRGGDAGFRRAAGLGHIGRKLHLLTSQACGGLVIHNCVQVGSFCCD
jgi:hypothetical protein